MVTNYWEHFSPEKEQQQARNLASAARVREFTRDLVDPRRHPEAGAWTTTGCRRSWTTTKSPLRREGEAGQYFRDEGVPTTFLLMLFYWDNFIHFGLGPQRGEDGCWCW